MMFPKQKRTKLKGNAKKQLRDEIFNRDGNSCVVCSSTDGLQHHHEPPGSKRNDTLQTGVVLCHRCHHQRHNGPHSWEIKRHCVWYLQQYYCQNHTNCGECENLLCYKAWKDGDGNG